MIALGLIALLAAATPPSRPAIHADAGPSVDARVPLQLISERYISATNGWALARDEDGHVRVLRTLDAGKVWHDATPAFVLASEGDVLSLRVIGNHEALATATSRDWPDRELLARTTDDGRFWSVDWERSPPRGTASLEQATADSNDGGTRVAEADAGVLLEAPAGSPNGADAGIDGGAAAATGKLVRYVPGEAWKLVDDPLPDVSTLPGRKDFSGTFNGAPLFVTLGFDGERAHGWAWYQTKSGGRTEPVRGSLSGGVLTINELDVDARVVSTARLEFVSDKDGYRGRWTGHDRKGVAQLRASNEPAIGSKSHHVRRMCPNPVDGVDARIACDLVVTRPAIFGGEPAQSKALEDVLARPVDRLSSDPLGIHGESGAVSFESKLWTPQLVTLIYRRTFGAQLSFEPASVEEVVTLDRKTLTPVRPDDVFAPGKFDDVERRVLTDAHIDYSNCVVGEGTEYEPAHVIGLTARGFLVCGTYCSNRSEGTSCAESPWKAFKAALLPTSRYAELWR